jgi:hypothetical protein
MSWLRPSRCIVEMYVFILSVKHHDKRKHKISFKSIEFVNENNLRAQHVSALPVHLHAQTILKKTLHNLHKIFLIFGFFK